MPTPLSATYSAAQRIITIDLLGDDFLESVKTGDAISVSEDGSVTVG
ncbi:MAG: hypothetical protein ACYTG5_19995 [Planctomycetota bacterium]|jgi:hypothetical protein